MALLQKKHNRVLSLDEYSNMIEDINPPHKKELLSYESYLRFREGIPSRNYLFSEEVFPTLREEFKHTPPKIHYSTIIINIFLVFFIIFMIM